MVTRFDRNSIRRVIGPGGGGLFYYPADALCVICNLEEELNLTLIQHGQRFGLPRKESGSWPGRAVLAALTAWRIEAAICREDGRPAAGSVWCRWRASIRCSKFNPGGEIFRRCSSACCRSDPEQIHWCGVAAVISWIWDLLSAASG